MRKQQSTLDIKIRRKANWMYALGIIGFIYALGLAIFGAKCLLPCEGETCHSCLTLAFIFLPFCSVPILLPIIIFNFSVSPSVVHYIGDANTKENLIVKHRHDIGKRLAWISPLILVILDLMIIFIR
ncbi:hypothetical protein IJJ36_02795 [Candidatus Saccharibacteria bacterium]|nr:hypothetical protein [Candidatus Saccharibacteria bacterium]MBR3263697.1 hypothetical protein [Candidatus Saccharibacteria bacterium]